MKQLQIPGVTTRDDLHHDAVRRTIRAHGELDRCAGGHKIRCDQDLPYTAGAYHRLQGRQERVERPSPYSNREPPCSVSATTRSVPGGGPSIVVAASSVSRRDWPPRQLTSARYRTTRSRPGRYCNPAPVSPRKSPSARSITGRSTSTACGPVRYAAAGRSGSSIVIPKSWPVVTRRQSSSTNLASSKPFHRSKRRTHRNPTSRHAATTRPDAPPRLVIAPIRLPLDIRRYAHANCNSSPSRIVIS